MDSDVRTTLLKSLNSCSNSCKKRLTQLTESKRLALLLAHEYQFQNSEFRLKMCMDNSLNATFTFEIENTNHV